MYLVLGQHQWCQTIFEEVLNYLDGEWVYLNSSPRDVYEYIRIYNPEYVFCLHWSHIIPADIVNDYECVCIHPTYLPIGRGGTPIQNMLVRNWHTTFVSAFRMTEELDAGPVYLKESMSLEGSALDIYERIMIIAAGFIERIIAEKIQPKPQRGTVTYFERRQPEESVLPQNESISNLYNFIRMLDAPDYPASFIEYGSYVVEFKNAHLEKGKLTASVEIKLKED
jgi:methionyl-tRNA formyltransferase